MAKSGKRNSVAVRVPFELKARLERLAIQIQASVEAGKTDRYESCEIGGSRGTIMPQHEIIRVALDELEGKMERSRLSGQRAKERRQAAKAAKLAGDASNEAS